MIGDQDLILDVTVEETEEEAEAAVIEDLVRDRIDVVEIEDVAIVHVEEAIVEKVETGEDPIVQEEMIEEMIEEVIEETEIIEDLPAP